MSSSKSLPQKVVQTQSSWSPTSFERIQTSLCGGVFDATLIDERPGFISVAFEGKGVRSLFADEPGGHRWQRVPPTEKRGRVHTSTVTVSVVDMNDRSVERLDMNDIEVTVARGSGPGGQHRNKTESCVTVVHRPTGTTAKADLRSQHRSREMALKVLEGRLKIAKERQMMDNMARERKAQKGSGMRGDKVRTYRVRDDVVTDHRTGRKLKLSSWLKGDW